MNAFQWDSCFVTGLDLVDQQHRHLVDLINQFGHLLMQPEGADADAIEQLFSELKDYAQYHFQEEEGLMERSAMDPRHMAQHRTEHAQFLHDVMVMHAGMAGDNAQEAHALLNYLSNWLAYHILGSDQLMARLLSASKTGTSADDVYHAYQHSRDPATATLLHAMTGLIDQVSSRSRALFELNQTLEARVAERTLALSQSNQQLENMAMTDMLTDLPNRRHAMLVLEREWQDALSRAAPLACMMIDADGFKTVNDSCGHDAGDEVLRQLARELRHAVRTDDMVFRLGGDEFFILCANTPLAGALQLAEKVRQSVASMRVSVAAGEWRGSISVGVAARNDAMKVSEHLLKAADEGVYIAKRKGRNCVATIQPF